MKVRHRRGSRFSRLLTRGVLSLLIVFMIMAMGYRGSASNGGGNITPDFTVPDGGSTTTKFNISGIVGTVASVTVKFTGFTSVRPDDLDMLLIAPDGSHNLEFMSDAGGTTTTGPITFTISDTGASGAVPDAGPLVNNANYQPGDYSSIETASEFCSGAGCPSTINHAQTNGVSTFTTAFGAASGLPTPNGTWTLIIVDDTLSIDAGTTITNVSLTINTVTAAPANLGGSVVTDAGQPLGGVTMMLQGTRTMRTITDASGNYVFRNVDTDQFYTVQPEIANYSFNPRSRSFTLTGNRSDATFTASADSTQTQNPLETPEYFVRQQYLDFLGREPDQGGLDFWAGKLRACGSDSACMSRERINVSAAFFQSEEFQQTGSFIYRLYKAGLGRELSYQEFSQDHARVVDNGALSASRDAFAASFVTRTEFVQKYSGANTAESFVDALLQTIRQADGVDLSPQRDALVAKYQAGGSPDEGRSLALRDAIEAASFREAEMNTSFVLTEYFGYLKRDADSGGYSFWLDVLNNRVPGNYQSMVCAFLTSSEYQRRFASVVTRSNSECSH